MDLDQFDQVVDAEVGEGHDAFFAEALDPDQPILRLHFHGDVDEKADIFAQVFGDKVNGSDIGDLVDLHVSGRKRCQGGRLRPPVPRHRFIGARRWMGGDAQKDINEAPTAGS